MDESFLQAKLSDAFRDVVMWRNLMALMPWTVHVDYEAERIAAERQRSRERAIRLLNRPSGIPTQRGVR